MYYVVKWTELESVFLSFDIFQDQSIWVLSLENLLGCMSKKKVQTSLLTSADSTPFLFAVN